MAVSRPLIKTILNCGVPAWVTALAGGVPGVVSAGDFTKNLSWQQGNPTGGRVQTTTGNQYVFWADGHVSLVPGADIPVSDLGLQAWEPSSNLLTNTNDLTQSNWTKTNMTAVLNAVGPDLLANSATTLTATAANATVLQSITKTSTNEQASVLIKSGTVTGAIQLTVDNGSTWHAVTVGAAWSQVSIPQQTLANPKYGIRIVNSGDSVVVWGNQVEPGLTGTGPTSPMPDGYTRSFFNTIHLPAVYTTTGTLLVKANKVNSTFGIFQNPQVNAGTTTVTATGGTPLVATLGTGNLSTGPAKIAIAFDASGRSLVANGGTVVSDTTAYDETGFMPTLASEFDGYVLSYVVWPYRLSSAASKLISTLP